MGVFARRRDDARRATARRRDARRRDATRAMLAAARPNAIARCARAEARGPGRDASMRARRGSDGGDGGDATARRAAAIEDDARGRDDDTCDARGRGERGAG